MYVQHAILFMENMKEVNYQYMFVLYCVCVQSTCEGIMHTHFRVVANLGKKECGM